MARVTLPRWQVSDALGAPLPGAKLYFFASGTSTPQATYANEALTIANSNPVVADASGTFGDIFLSPAVAYRMRLETATGSALWIADNVTDRPGIFDTNGHLPMGGKRVTGLGLPAASGDAVPVGADIKVPKELIPTNVTPADRITNANPTPWNGSFALTSTETQFTSVPIPTGTRRIFGVARAMMEAGGSPEVGEMNVILRNGAGTEDSRRLIAQVKMQNTSPGPGFASPSGGFRWDFPAGAALTGYNLHFAAVRGGGGGAITLTHYSAAVQFVQE